MKGLGSRVKSVRRNSPKVISLSSTYVDTEATNRTFALTVQSVFALQVNWKFISMYTRMLNRFVVVCVIKASNAKYVWNSISRDVLLNWDWMMLCILFESMMRSSVVTTEFLQSDSIRILTVCQHLAWFYSDSMQEYCLFLFALVSVCCAYLCVFVL